MRDDRSLTEHRFHESLDVVAQRGVSFSRRRAGKARVDRAHIPARVNEDQRGIRTKFVDDRHALGHLFADGLSRTDVAVKEWIGLVAYRMAGYTNSVFPGPIEAP